jgi:hypothetical protein
MLSQQKYSSFGATRVFFGNNAGSCGGYTNKKEIFMYNDDQEISTYRLEYARKYRELKALYGKGYVRNILCPCHSGKKFKNCCLQKYNKAYKAVEETQQTIQPDYRIGEYIAEMPIYEFWNGE